MITAQIEFRDLQAFLVGGFNPSEKDQIGSFPQIGMTQ